MTALLLCLAIGTSDPTLVLELDQLQGVWVRADGTRLVIDGSAFELVTADGESGFVARLVVFPRGRLALVEDGATVEAPYRVQGWRLRIAGWEYRRRR